MKITTEHGLYVVPHFTMSVQDGVLRISTEGYKDWKFYPFPEEDAFDGLFAEQQDEGWGLDGEVVGHGV